MRNIECSYSAVIRGGKCAIEIVYRATLELQEKRLELKKKKTFAFKIFKYVFQLLVPETFSIPSEYLETAIFSRAGAFLLPFQKIRSVESQIF